MDNENIIWFEKPDLTKPYIIMAFTGWANAGEVPVSVLWYLINHLEAVLFAELEPEKFYIYQNLETEIKRPIVNIENGIIQSYNEISTNCWYSHNGPEGHDIVIISGPEPEQNWNRYCEVLLNLSEEYNAEKIITLGGAFGAIPHTVPPRITGVVSLSGLTKDLVDHGIELVNYSGPSSIHSLLMLNATKLALPMVNLWAYTPHYIQVTNYMACYSLMVKLSEILDIELDLNIAQKDSEYLYTQVDEAIEKKPELQEYLKTLEAEYHKGQPSGKEPINQNILKEIEDLFKNKQG